MISAARQLLQSQRWAALASLGEDGFPCASSVAYALSGGGLVLHLSELAEHTRNLLARPEVSLLVSEPDPGASDLDPQTLPRLSLTGTMARIERETPAFARLAQAYVECFPDAAMRFSLGDFHLFEFQPVRGNYVGGLGRAKSLSEEEVREVLKA